MTQLLMAILRMFFGGSWEGEPLRWIAPYVDEYAIQCHAAYSETS